MGPLAAGNHTMSDQAMVASQKLRDSRGCSHQGHTQESLKIYFVKLFLKIPIWFLLYLHFCCELLTRLICSQSDWTYILKCRPVNLSWWQRMRRPKLKTGPWWHHVGPSWCLPDISTQRRTGSALLPPVPLCPCPTKGYEEVTRVLR